MKLILAKQAAACLLIYNHPSQVGEFSHADDLITKRLTSVLQGIDVRILDHLLVTGGTVVSMAELGRLMKDCGLIYSAMDIITDGMQMAKQLVLESVLTRLAFAHAQLELMPVDACQYFCECTRCGILLKPKAGDCCVFCSYGSVKCPPMQQSGAGCECAS